MTKYKNLNNNGKEVFLTLFEGSVYKLESDGTQDSLQKHEHGTLLWEILHTLFKNISF